MKLINKLEEIIKGIERHKRVNEDDQILLAQVLKMEVGRMKRVLQDQKELVERLELHRKLADVTSALATGIPLSVIEGKTKLRDHFSQSYIDFQTGKESQNDID